MEGAEAAELWAAALGGAARCAEHVCRVLAAPERDAALGRLRAHVAAAAQRDCEQRVALEALDRARRETDSTNIDDLETKFNDHLKKLASKQSNSESHSYMIEFNAKVSNFLQRNPDNFDDSDLAMTQSTEQYIDPITKKPIENPVKNRRCGHIYEQQSIMEILRSKKRLKCPVAGCGDKTFITPADLIYDEELKFRMTLTQHSTMVQDRSVLDLDCTN